MKRRATLVLSALLAVVAAASAAPASADSSQTCLAATTTHTLPSAKIVAGIGLTPDQIRMARVRIVTHQNLDGLGLTGAQYATIQQRIAVQVAAMNAHPVGWPCTPFQNRARVITYLTGRLRNAGFASLRFFYPSSRQIEFTAFADGTTFYGTAAMTGPRILAVQVTTTDRASDSYRFSLPFIG